MKILFCTNVFEVVENGPVKFANFLLRINERFPGVEVRILTEDVSQAKTQGIHKLDISKNQKKSSLSQFIRMWLYHREAMRLRTQYPFDVLVYNNALVGLYSAVRFKNTVGMINDYKNVSWNPSNIFSENKEIKRAFFKVTERWAARMAKKVIVNSDYLKEYVTREYNLSPQKVYKLYKGTEVATGSVMRPRTIFGSPIKVLFVKNDYVIGGLFTLIDALGLLQEYSFELIVLGPENVEELRIRDRIKSKNISLCFRGKVSQEEVQHWLKEADIFCVPSLKEAFGVANLEAMSVGVPVVSSNVGGIPEVTDAERCAFLAEPSNPVSLSMKIRSCIDNPEKRIRKVLEAQNKVSEFSVEKMLDQFITILKS